MMENIEPLTSEDRFERRVLDADKPVMVIFYRQWCEDSQALAIDMGGLVTEYGDRVFFYKVDIEEAPKLRERYNIRKTPTVILFVDREITRRMEEELEPRVYREALESVLAHR